MTTEKHFAVLGIAPGAPAEEIRRAYHRLSHQWHPDHHMQADEQRRRHAEEMFKRVNQAYDALSFTLSAGSLASFRHHGGPAGATSGEQGGAASLRERQLHMLAMAGTRARLLIVALRWNIKPDTFRRDVDVVRRIVGDAVVWGGRAFPRGFGAAWTIYLQQENLLSEEAHIRALLDELLSILAEGIPGQATITAAEWMPVLRLIDPQWPQSVTSRANRNRAHSAKGHAEHTASFSRGTQRTTSQTSGNQTSGNQATADRARRPIKVPLFSDQGPTAPRSQTLAAVFLLCGLAALVSSAVTLLTERAYTAPTLTFVLLYGGLGSIIAAVMVDRARS